MAVLTEKMDGKAGSENPITDALISLIRAYSIVLLITWVCARSNILYPCLAFYFLLPLTQ